ncbi:MAG: hypothetical protein AAF368_05285, partial [Planctomycetota bacterium]
MISTLILLTAVTLPVEPSNLATSIASRTVPSDEVADAIREAGTNVSSLLKLAESYEKASERSSAKRAYERVLELDSENERAREALRHQKYDGRWFESFVDLARYKREEAARMEAKGLARWKEEWVPTADVPFLRMGWVRDAKKAWMHPTELERAKEIEGWKAAGYQFRADDNSWIAPADFERWTALEWKCGDEWLDMEAANRFHSKIETMWEIAGENFLVLTTCGWNYGNSSRWHADRTHAELLRLFGIAPTTPPLLIVLDGLAQYNAAAAGVLLDVDGLSSLHGAYFADAAIDESVEPPRFTGVGVSYWADED